MTTTDRWYRDGRLHLGLGIEDTFVPQARPGERAIDEYELTEHYERFDADFALAAGVGAELLRWGVPWYRVAPEPGVWDWEWTDRAIESMLGHGIRPIIDLLHYGTPLWLDGQFAHTDYPRHVEEYARRFAERYGDRVTDYTPVNEPVIHALFSGEYGYWPPYLEGADGFARIAANLARGFVRSQRAIASVIGDRAVFVHVDAAMSFIGDDTAPEHREEAERLRHQVHLVEDLVTGRVDAAHPLRDRLASAVPDDELEWFRVNAVHPDIMGVNYYPRHSTELFEPGVRHGGGFADPRPSVDRGAEGLRESLLSFARRYGAPVMVTETCVTGTVDERLAWLDDSLALVEGMRADGADIVGYVWWPLFDMYEWTWRHTDAPRADHLLTMGLHDLVESPDGLLRVANPVADRYREHAGRLADAASTTTSSPTADHRRKNE
ncbi:family 1 glycosylhydrolase [Leifsonia aquatica]|uniref:Glycosyl hydrolase, family 1 n=2 Tax=Leifsonia aquatica TaxID=144185 RepID=U2RB55_LEIAQ|nr:family 1 glycosylhydrolase [Leifsonia aquatica]ERK72450.1 glycosyl hydrolase, family 1 [Leifsonia aquatica ATCC 14665]MBB2965277.1 beta-glucosidase/6-phospho-beta-glucosidase/beta-galactosidase [Leifsonia aquatica]